MEYGYRLEYVQNIKIIHWTKREMRQYDPGSLELMMNTNISVPETLERPKKYKNELPDLEPLCYTDFTSIKYVKFFSVIYVPLHSQTIERC